MHPGRADLHPDPGERMPRGLVLGVIVASAVGACLSVVAVLGLSPVAIPVGVDPSALAGPDPTAAQVSSAWPAALTAGLVSALTGLFIGAWIVRIIGTASPAPSVPDERWDPEQPQIIPDPRIHVLQNQRAALVRGLAEMLGTMPQELVWQARNVLQAGGVHAVVPDGELFDPGVHQAVGTEPVVDGARPETVARTVRAGYADGDRVLVPPRVVVYVGQTSAGTLR